MTVARIIQPKLHGLSGGLFGNWLPTTPVAIGDYGIIRDSRFERLGTLEEYGAAFDTEDAPGGRNNLEYKDKLEIEIEAVGEAKAAEAFAGHVSLRMSARGSFLYHLSNAATVRPTNTRQFNEEVIAVLLGEELRFPESGVVITEVLHAAKATIIVSDAKEAELNLKTAFKPGGDAFLAGAKGGVRAAGSRGSIFQYVAQDDMTALLRIVRPKIVPPGGGGAGMTARSIEWFKSLFRKRQLHVSDLIITPDQSAPTSRVTIALGSGGEVFTLQMEEVSVEEMVAVVAIEDAMGESDALEIEEREFDRGYRRAGGA